jgi:hypothetical protein
MPSIRTQLTALTGLVTAAGGVVAFITALTFACIAVSYYQSPNPFGVHDAAMHSAMLYAVVSGVVGAGLVKVGKDLIKEA